tara:strand:+ start:118828 stop:119955 length:1128 start_codon:yes stop_codon:yes gene_type:complete
VKKVIYLDIAASAPVNAEVLDIFVESTKNDFANPHAAHKLGVNLANKIKSSKLSIQQLFHQSFNVVFTSSATESNNLILSQFASGKSLCSSVYHPSMTEPLVKGEATFKELPINQYAQIDFVKLQEMNLNSFDLIALQWVNNQCGTIENIEKVSEYIKEVNSDCWIHVDGVQAIGKVDSNINFENIDSLSIGGHKIGAPKGIGCLLIKGEKSHLIKPLLKGGGQEDNLRSSTVSVPLVLSLTKALELQVNELKISSLVKKRHQIKSSLVEVIGDKVEFPFEEFSCPSILGFFINGISSDVVMRCLEEKGIIVSSSSACSSKSKKENLMLKKLGYSLDKQKSFLRISFDGCLSSDDIGEFQNRLASAWEDLSFLIR